MPGHFSKRHASLRTVAQRAGVSVATVSRIINGIGNRASPETIRRVRDAVAVLDYRPQSVGRALRQRESRIVGVLVANLGNPAMAAIAASIEAALRAEGYVMALCDTHENADIQDEYLREMEAQLARVIVMVVALESPMLDRLRRQGRPLIFVNRRDPGDQGSCFVGIDDHAAGRTVAAFCLRGGFRSPAVLHASIAYSAGALRLEGIRAEFAASGWSEDRIPTFTGDGINHMQIGYQAARKAMTSHVEADVLLCLSDLIAYGAYRWVRENATAIRNIPTFVSFDDNPLNDWINPWLNAMRIPYEDLGQGVVSAIGDLLSGNKNVVYLLKPKFIIRNPSGTFDPISGIDNIKTIVFDK